ncbi:MAG: acetamidase/formamidase family protein [Gammaproteobacteria bacterium]|jgi:formamidase|nr:acetamidase/formamidase family protein [Gammaproteobacteria bacterium]|tara:strand:+ start:822 stop:1433 length:612 start_codon:yes stop_codon:yes gene_type:complete
MNKLSLPSLLAFVIGTLLSSGAGAAEDIVVVGGEGADCIEDPGCVNRLHPDIPMAARARPGQTILFRARDARDVLGAAAAQTTEPETLSSDFGRVHPITGPVYIEGAVAGDVLKVTLTNIDPGSYAHTSGGSSGFILDLVDGQSLVIWRLNRNYAESDDLPGIRIPNAAFPVSSPPCPDPINCELCWNGNRSWRMPVDGFHCQ